MKQTKDDSETRQLDDSETGHLDDKAIWWQWNRAGNQMTETRQFDDSETGQFDDSETRQNM